MFEDFLKDKFMETYMGTGDDAPDRYEHWVSNLDVEQVIAYADEALLKEKEHGKL